MYVCVCNAITDKQIRAAAADGVHTLPDLRRELGVAARCGSCREMATDILRDSQSRAVSNPAACQPAPALPDVFQDGVQSQ